MKRLSLLTFLLVSTVFSYSQQTVPPGEPGFLDQYAGYNFKGNFAVKIESDDVSDFYLLDFSRTQTRFEQIYFLNLSFNDSRVVNLGFEEQKPIICYKSSNTFPENDVIAIFSDILGKTLKTSEEWTPGQQAEWLKSNDKYK